MGLVMPASAAMAFMLARGPSRRTTRSAASSSSSRRLPAPSSTGSAIGVPPSVGGSPATTYSQVRKFGTLLPKVTPRDPLIDSAGETMASNFTLDLNEDQTTVRDWLHGFAADVIRPAAAEWDEREETPWPVIQEAAKVGIYSLDFYAQQYFDPTGLSIPVVMEELFWGDAGIGLSIVGTTLAAVGVLANGTEEQIGTWVPQMFGTPDDVKLGAFCSSEPDAGSDVASMRTRAVYDEAADEWVINGTKTWATNGGIANVHVVVASVDPELGARGQASFVVPPGTKGLSQGQKFKKHGI